MRSTPAKAAHSGSRSHDSPTETGKTTAHTDTFHGRFVKLVTNEKVVEVVEFETKDPAMRGEMTITITLTDAEGGGTNVAAVHDGLPRGLSPADNETGWHMALAKLAALVEATQKSRTKARHHLRCCTMAPVRLLG